MGKYLNEEVVVRERVGQIGVNKDGDEMEIIEYNSYEDIVVEFLDGKGCVVHTQYINFLKGIVKNYNKAKVGKHGFIGQGQYSSEHRDENGNRVIHAEYKIWSGMHRRANNFDGKHPSYKDVTVCEEWWNYQNFAKWYNEHKYDVEDDFLCLDKDILYPESRIYSPETCCLVPNSINEIFKDFSNYKHDELPVGITRRTDSKSVRYRARTTTVNEFGDIVYANKTFNNVPDAYNFYKESKEKYIKFIAEKYKGLIDNKIYLKLMECEITTTVDLYSFI